MSKDYIVVGILRLQDSSDRCKVWKIEKGQITQLHSGDSYGAISLNNNVLTFTGTNPTVPTNFVLIQLD